MARIFNTHSNAKDWCSSPHRIAQFRFYNLKPQPGNELIIYALLFIAFVVLMVVFSLLKSILIPFALAVFLAYVLFPIVKLLTRIRIPYGLGGGDRLVFISLYLSGGGFDHRQ